MAKTSAVATASLVINAYKRRSALTAQNADVAPTTVGVTYLRFMKNVKTRTPIDSGFAWVARTEDGEEKGVILGEEHWKGMTINLDLAAER